MAQRLPAIVADGELNTSVRFGDQRDLDAAMLQQGRAVPQGVIDQFSGNPEERVVKPFGALSGDLNRMRDRRSDVVRAAIRSRASDSSGA